MFRSLALSLSLSLVTAVVSAQTTAQNAVATAPDTTQNAVVTPAVATTPGTPATLLATPAIANVTPAVAKPPYVGINTPAVAVTVPEDAPAPVVTDAKPAAKEAPKTVPLSQYNLSVYNEAVAELKALLANAQKYKDLSAANKALADAQQEQYDSAAQQFNRLIQFSPTFLSLDPAKYHWSMDKQDFVDAAGNSAAPIVKAEVKADPGKK